MSNMTVKELRQWEDILLSFMSTRMDGDGAHDMGHLYRVLRMARRIANAEGAHDPLTLLAACMTHDLVNVPKDSPFRSKASVLSADSAIEVLRDMGFPERCMDGVHHAVCAHSFSAKITPTTPEARALQDGDRLDALGAIGIARCFTVGGSLGRAPFDQTDPLGKARPMDELQWSMDHFSVKLLGLRDTMTTRTGRDIALERTNFLRLFMSRVNAECCGMTLDMEDKDETSLSGHCVPLK